MIATEIVCVILFGGVPIWWSPTGSFSFHGHEVCASNEGTDWTSSETARRTSYGTASPRIYRRNVSGTCRLSILLVTVRICICLLCVQM